MKRQPVESSNLASVGYDPDKQVLEIEFRHGGIYQYAEVPPDVQKALMGAPSLGSYFAANIRNVYPYSRIK